MTNAFSSLLHRMDTVSEDTCKFIILSNYNTSSGAFNIMQALANVRSLRGSVTPNVDEGVLKSFRNPYDTSLPCIRSRFEFRPGQVSISTNGTKLQLRACFKTGCGSADIASKDIDVSQR